MKSKLTYNPIREIVTVEDTDGNYEDVAYGEFINMCFQNNWEGTIYRLESARMGFEKVICELLSTELLEAGE